MLMTEVGITTLSLENADLLLLKVPLFDVCVQINILRINKTEQYGCENCIQM
jgi:hypothetical protein